MARLLSFVFTCYVMHWTGWVSLWFGSCISSSIINAFIMCIVVFIHVLVATFVFCWDWKSILLQAYNNQECIRYSFFILQRTHSDSAIYATVVQSTFYKTYKQFHRASNTKWMYQFTKHKFKHKKFLNIAIHTRKMHSDHYSNHLYIFAHIVSSIYVMYILLPSCCSFYLGIKGKAYWVDLYGQEQYTENIQKRFYLLY